MQKKMTIVGGGFSGLSLAYLLSLKNYQVEILEKSEQVGGMIQTTHWTQMVAESAANGLIWTPEIEKLFLELAVPFKVTKKEAKNRFIYSHGRLSKWPLSIFETFFFFFKLVPFFVCLLFKGRKRLAPQTLTSVYDWGVKNFGSPFTENVLAVGLRGIYAGDVKNLSAKLILGRFFEEKRKKYKGTIAPKEGMSALLLALKEKIEKRGGCIKHSQMKKLSEIQSPVVLATSLHHWKEISSTMDFSESEKEQIKQLGVKPLARVNISFTNPKAQLIGFGALINPKEQMRSLGILANSYIFEYSGSEYNESWIVGFKDENELKQFSDSEILSQVLEDREKVLKEKDQVSVFSIHRWPQALPVYDLQLETWLENFKNNLAPKLRKKNIYMTGNFLGQIGLSQIYNYNINLAELIDRDFNAIEK